MNKKRRKYAWLLVMIMLFSVFGYGTGEKTCEAASKSTLEVSYLDVGQSDCVLLRQDDCSMLIDAGDVGDGEEIVSYLKKQGIKKLDYVVASHPHADHIGGMQDVIESFSIGRIIMSKKTHTTDVYTNLLKAIKKKNLKITEAKVGSRYALGEAQFTLLAPNSYDYGSNINDYSVALRMVYQQNSFLFVGDSEKAAISDIMTNGQTIASDVLMCGHHGSDNSTTKAWVDKVNPDYAIISVGANNSYGHPKSSVLDILKRASVTCYRTDYKGTIIATANGKKISFKCTGNSVVSKSSTASTSYVYITDTGTKYHKPGCRYLSSSKYKISLSDAKKQGYEACKVCCK